MKRNGATKEVDVGELPPLPIGWRWGKISDAASSERNAIVDGPFGSNLKLSDYIPPPGVPVLTTANLRGDYSPDSVRYISKTKFQELRRSEVRAGDILVAKIGSCGLTGIYPPDMPSAIIPANLLKMTVAADISRKYVLYYLNSPIFGRFLKSIITATAQPAFNVSKFRLLPFPLAPLDEQERIVAEIEKQFTRLDAGAASLKRVQTALKRYRASVLKAACEGEWESATLGSLSVQSSYGTSVRCTYQSAGVPVLRIPNIQNGRIDLTDLKFAASAFDLDDENALKPNDFLIIRTNGSKDLIGRGAVVLFNFKRPYFFASYLIRFRIRDRDTAKWLSTVWNSENVRKQILQIAATSAGQYNVNQTNLAKISIPLPPLGDRMRIIAEVEQRLSVIEELEAVTSTELQRAIRLRQSILQQAFSGE